MMIPTKSLRPLAVSTLVCFGLFSGCDQKSDSAKSSPSKADATKRDHDKEHEHEHPPGTHGGTIVPLGADSYHAEALFEANGTLRLFMLGKDESRIHEIQVQTIKAFAKNPDSVEVKNIELNAEPQTGDSEGKTSQFVSKIPEELLGKSLRVLASRPQWRKSGVFQGSFSSTVSSVCLRRNWLEYHPSSRAGFIRSSSIEGHRSATANPWHW
ncbi:MAG: hypothetical protein ACKO3V_11095 [Pirellula sp.]